MIKDRSRQKGFTLIELMIVVVIIGILAALAIPRFSAATVKTRQGEAKLVLKNICTMQMTYRVESPTNAYFTSGEVGSATNQNAFINLGVVIPQNALYSYTIVPSGAYYVATATADLDGDGYDDIWTIDQTGVLTPVQNDATN